MSMRRPLLLALIFALLLPIGVSAAPTSSIVGTIETLDGAPIANATVTASGEKGQIATTRSDRKGAFTLPNLAAGNYEMSVYANGFAGITEHAVAVGPHGPTTVQVHLAKQQLSSLTTIATVSVNGASTLSVLPAPSVNINAQQYAAQGVNRISDIMQDELSTTVYPILGGGLNAPAVVSLRGPDPSETLVDVDGHQVNNGSTGDFDLSLVDPADLQYAQIVYGIAPSALYGPNTLGGALNVVTLEPTQQAHSLERLSIGSYGTEAGTVEATGTDGRLGYAFSLHRYISAGQLDNYQFPNTNNPGVPSVGTSAISNTEYATTALAKLRYSFGNGGFIGISYQGQNVYRDLSATLSSVEYPQDGAVNVPIYDNAGGSNVYSDLNEYDFDAQLPLGRPDASGESPWTAVYRHQTSFMQQAVNGQASGSSPYLYNDHDLIGDDTLELDRPLPKGSFAVKFAITSENLETDNILGTIYADDVARVNPDSWATYSPYESSAFDDVTDSYPNATYDDLTQTQRWVGARYTDDPTENLHYSLATYYSDYTTFGHSIDPRAGIVWTPTPDSALRLSFGTTFQSPQLPTFLMPPTPYTPIPVVDGYASIGNPNATAERATSYDIGYEHLFRLPRHDLHIAADLYRTNLHNGVTDFMGPTPCTTPTVTLAENPTCLLYPVNETHEVYEGLELHADYALAAFTTLRAAYDIDSVYTKDVPTSAQDYVLLYEQSLGVPLHKATLTINHDSGRGVAYYAGLLYEGEYNELDLPPYATLRAGVTWHLHNVDLTLAGENLTDTYNFLFTHVQGGIAYANVGIPATLTDAYPLPGPRVNFIVTHKL
jgi:outer membrane receptor protein involved in Fe transport